MCLGKMIVSGEISKICHPRGVVTFTIAQVKFCGQNPVIAIEIHPIGAKIFLKQISIMFKLLGLKLSVLYITTLLIRDNGPFFARKISLKYR